MGRLFSYNPTLESFAVIDTTSIEGVVSLTVGKDGLLYIAGGANDRDIFTYDPVSNTFTYKGSLGEGAKVLSIHCNKYGIIYIGCGENGYLVRYDPQRTWGDQQTSSSQDDPEVNPEMFHTDVGANTLVENTRGVIYFGALNRLYSFMGWELSQNIETHCMHITSIEMCLFGDNEIMGAGAKIMVVDNNGNPVQGACIVGNWTGISLGDNFDGYTDDNGLASIPCPRISHDLEGKFCFEVTNITRYKDWVYSEWIYSPEENIVSSAFINTSARIVASGAGNCKNTDMEEDTSQTAEQIMAEYIQGRLYITHFNAVYNCCLDRVRVMIGLEGNLIKLYEWEEADTPCDCTCAVDVTTQIEGLEPGTYSIRVYQEGGLQIGGIENVAI